MRGLAGTFVLLLLTSCGASPAQNSPTDASIDDFCVAKDWFVVEGMNRLMDRGVPQPDELAELARDWSIEMARVGTPANISADGRAGYEKFVARISDVDGDDMSSDAPGWQAGDWEGEEEKAFAAYTTNTCG